MAGRSAALWTTSVGSGSVSAFEAILPLAIGLPYAPLRLGQTDIVEK